MCKLPFRILFTAIVVTIVGCGQQASAPILSTVSPLPSPQDASVATPANPNTSPIDTPLPLELRRTIIAESGLPTLGIVVDKEMRVASVELGSAADKAGIATGDLLQAIQDIPFTRANDVRNIIRRSQFGEILTLTLKREGKDLQIKVVLVIRDISDALKSSPDLKVTAPPPGYLYF